MSVACKSRTQRLEEGTVAFMRCMSDPSHVLRIVPGDPVRQVTLCSGTGEPKFERKSRVGHPRLKLTIECYTAAKREFLRDGEPYRLGQRRVGDEVLQAALDRRF